MSDKPERSLKAIEQSEMTQKYGKRWSPNFQLNTHSPMNYSRANSGQFPSSRQFDHVRR